MLKKILYAIGLTLLATISASVYGICHDQLTYTLSPEFFHCFKFIQFGIGETLHTRAGVTLVGIISTWWVGLVAGASLTMLALIFPTETYIKRVLRGFAMILGVSLTLAIAAAILGISAINADKLPPLPFPESVEDKVSYARVGLIHNFSYVGAAIGWLVAITHFIMTWRREKKGLHPDHAAPHRFFPQASSAQSTAADNGTDSSDTTESCPKDAQ